MKKTRISDQWLRHAPCDDGFVPVCLPDDYAVKTVRSQGAPGGGSNGYYAGGAADYVRYLSGLREGRHYILDLDGAYMCAEISVNGDQMAMHPHGYTPFLLDVTPKIRPGRTNKLQIHTDDLQCSTRWYSGAGLYRDVFLWEGGSVRVEPWDVHITTPDADEYAATVEVSAVVTADEDGEACFVAEIAGTGARITMPLSLQAGKNPISFRLFLPEPALWSPETPVLYTLSFSLTKNGETTDTGDVSFGIRTLTVNAKEGLLLNGKPIKLRGGCIHHDHGGLGAAAFPAAEARKVDKLKAAGFNALRIAHNPPSLALLEHCDRVGMLLIDEAFDMWNMKKSPRDYHYWFADWWARDVSYMLGRDRNHPSVIAWSIGNEVPERDGSSDGALWSEKLAAEVRKYDTSRPVTAAMCAMWMEPEPSDPDDYKEDFFRGHPDKGDGSPESSWDEWTNGNAAPLDMVGYNYLWERYDLDSVRYPDRVIWGSETHALKFYDSWDRTTAHPNVLGDFTWTAFDNIGEAGTGRACWARDGYVPGICLADYPWRTCFQGDLDLAGFRRPQSYFREAVWLDAAPRAIFTIDPEHNGEGFSGTGWHFRDLHDCWNFDEKHLGAPVHCEVYTRDGDVEWTCNGKKIGVSRPEKGVAVMDIPYEPGTVTATVTRNGKVFATAVLQTVGAAAAISLSPEKTAFRADGRDLLYVDVEVRDADGRHVPCDKSELRCDVSGGKLLAVFSGDPANEDVYGSPVCHAFDGHAVAVVAADEPGSVTVSVSSPALSPAAVTVTANA